MKNLMLLFLTNLTMIFGLTTFGYFFYGEDLLNLLGLDYKFLFFFSLFWGFFVAFLNLLLSKHIAKYFLDIQIINRKNRLTSFEHNILTYVDEISKVAGIKSPQVGFYDSPEINAFVTGYDKNNALLALSSSILNVLNKDQIRGVVAHEIAHLKNGDMVTMTLIQGSLNAFSIFMSKAITFFIFNSVFGEKHKMINGLYVFYGWMNNFFQSFFLFFGSIITNFFSRRREFRADLEGATLVGKNVMIQTLYGLLKHEDFATYNNLKCDEYLSCMKMHTYVPKSSFFGLFDTHPSLIKRINYIKKHAKDEDFDELNEKAG